MDRVVAFFNNKYIVAAAMFLFVLGFARRFVGR